MKIINISQGKQALVDDEWFDYLRQWKWQFSSGYAVRGTFIDKNTKKRVTVPMHRVINNTPDEFVTDHINGDKLDNRMVNLRTCTNGENMFNTGLRKNNVSGCTGVNWCKTREKWVVTLGERKLGRRDTFEEAVALRKLHEPSLPKVERIR